MLRWGNPQSSHLSHSPLRWLTYGDTLSLSVCLSLFSLSFFSLTPININSWSEHQSVTASRFKSTGWIRWSEAVERVLRPDHRCWDAETFGRLTGPADKRQRETMTTVRHHLAQALIWAALCLMAQQASGKDYFSKEMEKRQNHLSTYFVSIVYHCAIRGTLQT